MSLSEARENLMAKQSALVSARQTRDKTAAGLERAAAIAAGMVAEGDTLDEAERAETRAAVDVLTAGGDLPKPGAKKTAHAQRVDLEGRQRGVADMIAVLESQLAEAETAVEAAKAGEKAAVDQVIAADIGAELAQAQQLFADLTSLLPKLNAAAQLGLPVHGLRDFVFMLAPVTQHGLSTFDPSTASAAAKMRAWAKALEANHAAQMTDEEVAAIERANAAAIAARDDAARVEEEVYQAERAAERAELQRKNREAEAARQASIEEGIIHPRFGPPILDPCEAMRRWNSGEDEVFGG